MKVGKEPLLTIVVPAYNVEKYLGQCLDSLVNQTVMDHKIIVVDDGATDHTGQIADDYQARYPELITVIHQENHGLGASRNVGLALADTQYVTFLDSDDWQDCLFMEKLKRELNRQEEAPDIIFTLPWIYNEATKQIEEWHDKLLMERLFYPDGGEENVPSCGMNVNMERGFCLYALEPSSCRRIYRTMFLREIHFSFPVGVKWEDVQPHFLAIHHAQRCIGIKGTGFYYRINTSGQITSGGGMSRLDIIPVFKNTLEMAYSQGWQVQEIAYIIKMLWSFTNWSISVANCDVIFPLLDQLHIFFKEIPQKYVLAYCKQCSDNAKRDKIIMAFLRGPFYRLLRDYRTRQMAWNLIAKIYRIKNKLRR